ncbi:MAG: hypothetical protein Q9191_001733 [Dirinaria sp. TL-2023a]
MTIRGQRFHIDLDSDDEANAPKPTIIPAHSGGSFLGLVGDIKERTSSLEGAIPSPPKLKSTETGFPSHKKRASSSRFQQRRSGLSASNGGDVGPPGSSQASQTNLNSNGSTTSPPLEQGNLLAGREHQRIDEENRERLAQMTPAEIEEEREELMKALKPSLIERLLKKATIDDGSTDREPEPEPEPEPKPEPVDAGKATAGPKRVTFEAPIPADDLAPSSKDCTAASENHDSPTTEKESPYLSIMPEGGSVPQLDPSSPEFLAELHDKYYPELPTNPSALSWMQPLPKTSSYDPSAESVSAAAIRFDFRGHILPPRLSSQLPSTMGLHHHAHAPSSAGYTIPELAHLARSTFPAQRCIAMQTLGRILYRLGRGDFGPAEEDLCEGLWQEMERGRVIDILIEVAAGNGEKGSRSVWVTATEAVWLWRKGGGRRWTGR